MGRRYRFGWSRRLHGRLAFRAVFDSRCRKHMGPVTLYAKPNTVGHCRLGLTVSRKVGHAVQRNRIKRLLREAFRLTQHDLTQITGGYDMVVVVRPHAPQKLIDYQQLLIGGVRSLCDQWQRRKVALDP